MILWNADLTKRLACSDKEKAALPSIVGELLDMADKARIEGIKTLNGAVSQEESPMLYYGFRMIAEGLSTETLEEILAVYLSTSTFSGFDFLKQCLYIEALLGIASGDPRELLLRKLAPYCGADKAFGLLNALEPGSGTNPRDANPRGENSQ
jgi:hypothetical protein